MKLRRTASIAAATAALVVPVGMIAAPSASAAGGIVVVNPENVSVPGTGECVYYTGGSAGEDQWGPWVSTGQAYVYSC